MAHRLRRSFLALPVFLLLALPAAAADKETPGELASDARSKMVRALELLIQQIPQYEKPEINENGDIIIRRRHPKTAPQPQKPEDKDRPDTGRSI
jgi:hypothetical protein